MKALLIVLALSAVVLCVAGCSGKTQEPAPPTLPAATAEPTAEALRPIAPPAGTFVVLDDGDLSLVSLTDPTRSRQLTQGAVGVGYAGSVRTPAGTELYYSLEEDLGSGDLRYSVMRTSLGAAADAEKVLSFTTWRPVDEFICCIASVSSDGRRIAYIDVSGLRVRDLATGEDLLLDANGPEVCIPSVPPCYPSYASTFPRWSRDGHWLTYWRVKYEGADLMAIEPASQLPAVRIYGNATMNAAWSPDSRRVCTGNNEVSPAVVDVPSAAVRFIASDADPDVAGSCVWSPRGDLALSYAYGRVGLFDAGLTPIGNTQADSGIGAWNVTAEAWLPDSSAVVARLRYERRTVLIARNGGQTTLDLDADRVFEVLPP